MREIEFRGKDCEDKWVYGQLTIIEDDYYINYLDEVVGAFSDTRYIDYIGTEVSERTVGQFTGLKDKNGKKIFEGDIVKLTETNYNYGWTAVVEFGNPNSEYVWGWNLKPITKDVEYNLDILCWVEMPIGATCEIIGNIYDNPELLGEEG